MAIGRTDDRNNPRDPMVLRHRLGVWEPIGATHLGQRSQPTAQTGRTHDRNRPDPFELPNLAKRGPSTHGFRARRLQRRPGMTLCRAFLCQAARGFAAGAREAPTVPR